MGDDLYQALREAPVSRFIVSREGSDFKHNYLCIKVSIPNIQSGQCYGEVESSRPGTSRVEVQHAVLPSYAAAMGVAGDNGFESGRHRIQVELLHVVEHIEMQSSDLNDLMIWQCLRPCTLVAVPANRNDLGDVPELVQNLMISDITRVDNEPGP